MQHTGFVASMLDCSDELRQLFPDFLEENLPCTHFLRLSVEWIRFASNIEDLDIPMILAMRSDRETENSRPVTLQGQLTKLVERHNLTYLKDYMDNRRLAWFLSSSDAFASTFLNVLPKCPAFTFTSEEMRVLLNHRFYLAQPDRSKICGAYARTGGLVSTQLLMSELITALLDVLRGDSEAIFMTQ